MVSARKSKKGGYRGVSKAGLVEVEHLLLSLHSLLPPALRESQP